MLTNDLFNTDYERRISEGAVDRLEQRRIDDLNMKMDELANRVKSTDNPEHKKSLLKAFLDCKEERDSYYKLREAGMAQPQLRQAPQRPQAAKAQPGAAGQRPAARPASSTPPTAATKASPVVAATAQEPMPMADYVKQHPTDKFHQETGEMTPYGKAQADAEARYQERAKAIRAQQAQTAPAAAPAPAPAATTKPANIGATDNSVGDAAIAAQRSGKDANAAARAAMAKQNPELAKLWAQQGLDDQGRPIKEAGIGQDIANKSEKMARATPPTKAGAVASTVKNAAKWLAGKGGPGREGPTYEGADDIEDRGEYDREGDMAKDNIHTIVRNARELESVIGNDDNLPEWVQDKLANIKGMMTAVSEYMQTQHERDSIVPEGTETQWSKEEPWRKVPKNKSGRPVDPRGEVAHMSDVARRQSAVKAQAQKKNSKEVAEHAGLNEAGKTMDPDEVGYMLSKSTIQKIVNNVFAQKLPDVKPVVKTANADTGTYSVTTPDGMFKLEFTVAGQEGDIGIYVENAYNSYKGTGVVADIFRDCYAAAERQWGQPLTRTLQPVQDTGHGVWQAMADKLGVTYEAGARTVDTSAAAPTKQHKGPRVGKAEGTPPKPGNTKEAIIINSNGGEWAPMDMTAEQGQEYLTGMDNPITLRWVDGTEKPATVTKESSERYDARTEAKKAYSFIRDNWMDEVELRKYAGRTRSPQAFFQAVRAYREKAGQDSILTALARAFDSVYTRSGDSPWHAKESSLDEHGGGIGPKQRWQDLMPEGFQDFNKVEPYAVCLAGRPVKKFDYYEEARRFHDNWKKKLYREGDKAKADKITLMPLGLDEGDKFNDPMGYNAATSKAAMMMGYNRFMDVPNSEIDKVHALADKIQKEKHRTMHEAGSPAQQAAIAIAMKKAGKKPKTDEAQTDYQKRRQRERDVDAGRPVKALPKNPQTDYARKRAKEKRDLDLFGEETTRLDPKCWKGKKIGTPKTKVKGGVRVNNCVPAESVNEDQDTSGVESAILRRIMVAHVDWLQKFGPDKVMQAAEEVAYNVGDVDEIGTSDVSAYVHEVGQILGAV